MILFRIVLHQMVTFKMQMMSTQIVQMIYLLIHMIVLLILLMNQHGTQLVMATQSLMNVVYVMVVV